MAKNIFKEKNKGFDIYSDIDITKKELVINFKGSYYKITLSIYTDVLNIHEILYICDVIDKNKGNYKNIVLGSYETEYKQIETLLKKYYFEV